MNKTPIAIAASAVAALVLAACATSSSEPDPAQVDAAAQAMLKTSFREQGIAKLDRLQQDEIQQACSGDKAPPAAVTAKLEAAQMATVKWPADGKYLGDWKEGEKLAQN